MFKENLLFEYISEVRGNIDHSQAIFSHSIYIFNRQEGENIYYFINNRLVVKNISTLLKNDDAMINKKSEIISELIKNDYVLN